MDVKSENSEKRDPGGEKGVPEGLSCVLGSEVGPPRAADSRRKGSLWRLRKYLASSVLTPSGLGGKVMIESSSRCW